jgi:hypothetical protein
LTPVFTARMCTFKEDDREVVVVEVVLRKASVCWVAANMFYRLFYRLV